MTSPFKPVLNWSALAVAESLVGLSGLELVDFRLEYKLVLSGGIVSVFPGCLLVVCLCLRLSLCKL